MAWWAYVRSGISAKPTANRAECLRSTAVGGLENHHERGTIENVTLSGYITPMDRNTVVQILLTHRAELEQLGVTSLSVFGSTSRGEQTPQSDVDLAITFDSERTPKGLAAIGRLTLIETKLCQALGAPIDVVPEPARKPAVQAAIERDRLRVY